MIVNEEEKERMKTMRNCISKFAFTILHFTWLFIITFFFLIFLPRFPAFLGKQVFYGGRVFFSDKKRRPLILYLGDVCVYKKEYVSGVNY